MKVAPDSVVPTMPKATSIQLLLLLPMKKLSLLALREVAQATPSRSAKYAMRMQKRSAGDIEVPIINDYAPSNIHRT
jgi:hypothetical protein